MSSKITQKIWPKLWEPASPFLGCLRRSQSMQPSSSKTTFSPVLRRAFSWTRPRLQRGSQRKPSVLKSFTSCGILFIDISPASTSSPQITTCATAAEKTLFSTTTFPRRSITSLASQAWRRDIHSSSRKGRGYMKRNKSSISNGQNTRKPLPDANTTAASKAKGSEPVEAEKSLNTYLHLPSLPKMPHRPTKEEMLAAATGFWSRLKVRFKWFSIRSARPWNIDDWSAFISWFVLGNIVWVLVGTTTFFSLVILSINTVVAQETLARWVGDYLTHSAGVKVVFESAIVPKWKDGVITFHNVFVSRRPGQGNSKVSKGSSISAAAAAAAERQADQGGKLGEEEEEDTNYTQFDVTIGTVNVTLSFVKWWNGKGLLQYVEVKGVRGVVDRTSVHWPAEYVDPRTYRHEHQLGDFEIESFKLEDLLVTIHQPDGFRPFSVSIFNCELPQLRKQWLFYDFMSANNMSGAFDGSLFTIHPRQMHGFAGSHLESSENGESSPWKKHSRLRIDGLKIDHLNRGVDGPFGWIQEGNVDIVADVMLPAETDDSIARVVSDIYDRMEATVTANRYLNILDHNHNHDSEHAKKKILIKKSPEDDDRRFLVMDLRVHLNDVRASVPLFTRDLSYINQALIRPIVAYINSQNAFIPVNCRIVKRASEFDGSWTIFDSGLMEDLSAETYEAFAKDVMDSQARRRRLKKVGFWSISLAIQAIFMGMAGSVA